jgi:hypothetical protein
MSLHHRHIVIQILLLATGLFLSACKDSSPSSIVFPQKNISYEQQVQPLFTLACATSECHDRLTRRSSVDLSSYAGLKGAPYGIVIPKDTLNSRLIWCIEGRPESFLMPPPPLPPLSISQIKGLIQWIYEGATDTP